PVTYFAGFVSKMKFRNDSGFHDMAQVAMNQYGTAPTAPPAGMWIGTLKYRPIEALTLRGSAYYVENILTSSYGDITWSAPMTHDVRLVLSSNVMVQGSNGANYLTGRPFSTWSAGARAILGWGDATVYASYMQTGSAAPYRTPYGQWIGYGKQIDKDFDRANERAFQVGTTYNFAGIGLDGLTLLADATMGAGAIDPDTGADIVNNTEFDIDLQYHFAAERWPDWLKPLALRGRLALVDQNLSGRRSTIAEYRLILNYELRFGGGNRR